MASIWSFVTAPAKLAIGGAGWRYQESDCRGGLRIDLKGLEEGLFRVIGGIEHYDLRPFGVLRIGLERFDALHRLFAELSLVILHAEQDRMSVLDGLHARGLAWGDESLLKLGLVETLRESAGGGPVGSDSQNQRHG